MGDWRTKLEGLNRELLAKEKNQQEEKVATLKAFRQRLLQLEAVVKTATEFGDAFGVDCEHSVSRFDERYPYLRFRIKRPALTYEVLCRDGAIVETVKEGEGAAAMATVTLESLAPKLFEKRITAWVERAANANRKVPGTRR